ncbi:uncharacterized protein LOC143849514 [Tasmannia lanceolata]|uniref:uncharacterized protein LOC143849514 n=1 Tax=Tasmannia lanceolata TaxID=3420 RepID=UPI004063C178
MKAQYAHKAALIKHSIWSSIVVDVLLGNIFGLALLVHAEAAYFWVLHLSGDITNNLLRSGCVWLMGVPAGFKLNTELAEILGMISLDAIQIWSTLWFFLGFLFQGRKWNIPLRQRLDSYDYSVGRHVVGSLLFTPLLLLPTTSVFYIFFTIMSATISCICIIIEVTISILHATPCAEIFLLMVTPRKFPSGIWFQIITGQSSNIPTSAKHGILNEGCSPFNSQERRKTGHRNNERPGTVVSILCSNFASIGQIVLPHYRKVFHEVSLSSGTTSAYGVLSGRSIPSSLGTGLPLTLPWFYISFREYWGLCRKSVLACR